VKRVARGTVVGALAVLALVTPSRPAGACSCVVRDLAAQVQAAAVVFVGRVDAQNDSGVATFEVARAYKGGAAGRLDVMGGGPGEECAVPLAEGRTYLVFANSTATGLATNLCSGTTDDPAVADRLFASAATTSPSPVAAPPTFHATKVSSRAMPMAAAAALAVLVAGAMVLTLRSRRRPRPIA